MSDSPAPRGPGIPHDLFDAFPAPSFVVDADVRLLRANRAARALLCGSADGALPTLCGEALGCVNAREPGGCGRQPACATCGIRSAVAQALASGAVQRGRAVMRLRGRDAASDACFLVSASPVLDGGAPRALITIEDVSDPGDQDPQIELANLVDPEPLRAMMVEFNKLTGIPLAIIDRHGRVLVGIGWQDVCTKFHRVHPETCKHCLESDTELTAGVPAGQIRRYRCRNNMWDVATPIVVGDRHLGNVFMGQFFFEDEPIDTAVFREQAARYGFDEREYLAALDRVPRLRRDAVSAAMKFFLRFAAMLSGSSYTNLKLARAVSERDRLMRSVRQTNERLAETDRRRTEFLAVLSHELRNPLAPIRNSLYLLDRAAPGSAQASRAKAVIDRQVDHLTRLVDDLLDVTRVSHGKIPLAVARVDVRALVAEVCDDNRATLEKRGLALHVDLPPPPAWIEGDGTRIAQAVGNLVQNAAKFTPAGGRVDVQVETRERHVEITVRDTGAGIDPADLDKIFQPFAQGEQDLARTHGGLGLGLALVRGLVELHGGTVRASSAGLGRGAAFVITLPRRAEAPAGETGAA